MGPIILSLNYMMKDVLLFLITFTVIMLAFASGVAYIFNMASGGSNLSLRPGVDFIKVGRRSKAQNAPKIWEKCKTLSARRKCMMLKESKFVLKGWAQRAIFKCRA
jgi:hypothetical protein